MQSLCRNVVDISKNTVGREFIVFIHHNINHIIKYLINMEYLKTLDIHFQFHTSIFVYLLFHHKVNNI